MRVLENNRAFTDYKGTYVQPGCIRLQDSTGRDTVGRPAAPPKKKVRTRAQQNCTSVDRHRNTKSSIRGDWYAPRPTLRILETGDSNNTKQKSISYTQRYPRQKETYTLNTFENRFEATLQIRSNGTRGQQPHAAQLYCRKGTNLLLRDPVHQSGFLFPFSFFRTTNLPSNRILTAHRSST